MAIVPTTKLTRRVFIARQDSIAPAKVRVGMTPKYRHPTAFVIFVPSWLYLWQADLQ